ncbi:MAG: TRAP transporter small permease [Thermodesulfobacteriota bacterium]
MKSLQRFTESAAMGLHYVAGAAVVAMMLLTCADVVLRYFRMPIPGAFEITAQLGALAVAFSLAHTTLAKGHVAVSLLVRRFPKRVQNAIDCITSSLGCFLFVVATWQMILVGLGQQRAGQVSMTIKIPLYPVVYAIAFSLAMVALVLLVEALGSLVRLVKPGPSPSMDALAGRASQ